MNKFTITTIICLLTFSLTAFTSNVDTKSLRKQVSSKDKAESYNATAELVAIYIKDGEIKKAEKLLKGFQSPSNFDNLPQS